MMLSSNISIMPFVMLLALMAGAKSVSASDVRCTLEIGSGAIHKESPLFANICVTDLESGSLYNPFGCPELGKQIRLFLWDADSKPVAEFQQITRGRPLSNLVHREVSNDGGNSFGSRNLWTLARTASNLDAGEYQVGAVILSFWANAAEHDIRAVSNCVPLTILPTIVPLPDDLKNRRLVPPDNGHFDIRLSSSKATARVAEELAFFVEFDNATDEEVDLLNWTFSTMLRPRTGQLLCFDQDGNCVYDLLAGDGPSTVTAFFPDFWLTLPPHCFFRTRITGFPPGRTGRHRLQFIALDQLRSPSALRGREWEEVDHFKTWFKQYPGRPILHSNVIEVEITPQPAAP